jgi:hypothetical protein
VSANDSLEMMENAVLGVVLRNPNLGPFFMETVRHTEFGGPKATLAEVVVEMLERGDSIDLLTVNERLRTTGRQSRCDMNRVFDAWNAGEYVLDPRGMMRSLADRYLARRGEVVAARFHTMLQTGDVADAVSFARREVESMDLALTTASDAVEPLTMREFLATDFPRQGWAIPPILHKGTSCVVLGSEGMGKSVFLRQLAVSAACGIDPFSPHDRTKDYEPKRVVIVDGEYPPHTIQRQVNRVAEFSRRYKPFDEEAQDRIAIHHAQGRFDLTDPTDQKYLHSLVHAHRADVLIIGPLYMVTSKSINDDEDARQYIAPLQRLLGEGVAVVLEHHMGNEGHDGRRQPRPLGSSILRRWAGQGIVLKSEMCEEHNEFDCARCGKKGSIITFRHARDEVHWPKRVVSPKDGSYWWMRDTVAEGLAE